VLLSVRRHLHCTDTPQGSCARSCAHKGQLRKVRCARGSRAPRVFARTHTHPRTETPAAGAHAAGAAALPPPPACPALILPLPSSTSASTLFLSRPVLPRQLWRVVGWISTPSFTQSPSPPRSLVRDGQTSPHRPRLVVSRSTCPPISPPPHANSFVLGPAVTNTHTPARSDQWGGEHVVGGVLPRMNIGADMWGESSIMTGVYERGCSSTLHIGWGLCDV